MKKQDIILYFIKEESNINGIALVERVAKKVTLLNITSEEFERIINRMWDRGYITKNRGVIRMTEDGEKLLSDSFPVRSLL